VGERGVLPLTVGRHRPRPGTSIPLGAFTTLLTFALSAPMAARAEEAPSLLVDKGACPFECCTYGRWKTKRAVSLVATPEDESAPVGSLAPGTEVRALTGEVHTSAGLVLVRLAHGTLHPGDEILVYTYLGEGHFKVWHRSGFFDLALGVGPTQLSEAHWFSVVREPKSRWWVQVEAPGGPSGWTQEPEAFSGKDACS